MTGYGKSVHKNKNFSVCVDLKSINSRFIEVITKTHRILKEFDNDIISLIKKECIRGKIVINISLTNNNDNKFVLNKYKLNSLIDLSKQIKNKINSEDKLLLSDILNIPEIYDEVNVLDNTTNKRLIIKGVKEAIKDLKTFRKKQIKLQEI